jgi:prephenate dehydrogenase
MSTGFARIAVVGTGLIGGSFCLAVRALATRALGASGRAGSGTLPGAEIVGWDRPEVLERALASGIISEAHSGLAEAIAGADLIYVALPVGATIDRLPEIARHAPPRALVTDAASTKRAVCAAAKCFTGGARFLGGHPMAGNEVSGLDAADAELFRGAKYALIGDAGDDVADDAGDGAPHSAATPAGADDARVASFLHLLAGIGARPMWMDAAQHDRAVAVVSHLPQLVAVALAGVVRSETDDAGLPLTLAGRGLRDALRLAGSPYALWRDIVFTNTDHLDASLARMGHAIEHLRVNLRQRELADEFADANEVYKILRDLQ